MVNCDKLMMVLSFSQQVQKDPEFYRARGTCEFYSQESLQQGGKDSDTFVFNLASATYYICALGPVPELLNP